MSRYSFIVLLAVLGTANTDAEPSSTVNGPIVVKAGGPSGENSSSPAPTVKAASSEPQSESVGHPSGNKDSSDATEGNRNSFEDTDRSGAAQIFSIGHDAVLAKGGRAAEVMAVFGSATNEGDVSGEVLSVFGETHISGHTGGEAVAVFGDNFINGRVDGEAVTVLGDAELGPQADVGGDVVVVGGALRRSAGAVIHGNVQDVGAFLTGSVHRLSRWLHECLLYGRMLGFSADLGWAWGLALGFLVLYLLLALLFRDPLERCLQTLDTRPGLSILAGLLTLLLTPILFVLLTITLVGVLAVPLIGTALICACMFGKAVVLGWLGRRFTGSLQAPQALAHPAVAVLIGGTIVLVLYTVPIVGIIVYNLLRVLALGTVVYALILATQRSAAVHASRAAQTAAVASASAAGTATDSSSATPSAEPAADVPPPTGDAKSLGGTAQETALPPSGAAASNRAASADTAPRPVTWARAGFWIRMGALFIDVVLVSVLWHLLRGHDADDRSLPLLVLAAYGAILWKLKGATVGGLVCDLRVVRVDRREIDWSTAIVRALSCFLSLVVAGLGFFWIVFDSERQAWHDKIAGTLVVRVPKGQPTAYRSAAKE